MCRKITWKFNISVHFLRDFLELKLGLIMRRYYVEILLYIMFTFNAYRIIIVPSIAIIGQFRPE